MGTFYLVFTSSGKFITPELIKEAYGVMCTSKLLKEFSW